MLITQKVGKHIPSLRGKALSEAVFEAIKAGSDRLGCKVVEFCIQSDHLHFIIEGGAGDALSRFMKGLNCRIAKAINRTIGRKGKVFADRYNREDKVSLRAVYNAIRYVLCNSNKHGKDFEEALDPKSSARWFPSWLGDKRAPESTSPLPQSTNWKVRNCVRYYGPMDPAYRPPA